MGGGYEGVKFNVVFEKKEAPKYDAEAEELIKWCRLFAKMKLTTPAGGGYSGNLSFRTPKGFVITGSSKSKETLGKEDLVEVLSCDKGKKEVRVNGLLNPSSEAFMHQLIYDAMPEVKAVFHLHDNEVVAKGEAMGLPITADTPYGSIERAEDTLKSLKGGNYVVLRNEGMVAAGRSMQEAGELTLEKNRLAKER